MAALGGESPEFDLRLSKAQRRRVADLRKAATSGMAASELGYRYGRAFASDAILLRSALLETTFDVAKLAAAEIGARAKYPIKAADLMPDVMGDALGARLDELETRWIASGFTLTKEDLLQGPA